MNINLSVEEMTKAGLQFGHKKSKVHPKMKPYLFGVRNTVFIIDLDKSKEKMEAALEYIQSMVAQGKSILFVGTKTQFKGMVKDIAVSCGMQYVNERWLGGTFTNFKVIKKRIEYFKEIERKKLAGEYEKYTKKEQAGIAKELKDLEHKLGGIKDMERIPDAVFVVDMKKDKLAVKEARENGVTVIGIADVNINPDMADYPIVANDDAISSVGYILDKVKEAVLEGKKNIVEAKPAEIK